MRFNILVFVAVLMFFPVTGFAQMAVPSAGQAANLTPQQRQQYLDVYNKMSPAQRKALANQVQESWKQITPEQKEAIKNQALQQWQKISPEEKRALATQAQQKWQEMTPEDKKNLTNQFSDLLSGAMQQK